MGFIINYQVLSFGDVKKIIPTAFLQAMYMAFLIFYISMGEVEENQTKLIFMLILWFIISCLIIVFYFTQGD